MRTRIAMGLKVHEDHEFMLLSALGADLPGAVVMQAIDTPAHLFGRASHGHHASDAQGDGAYRFALAGMQMKFSMLQQGERFTLPGSGQLGNHIVKPPCHDFEARPMVEAATMETASAAGINVPEVLLLPPTSIEGLPNMRATGAMSPSMPSAALTAPKQAVSTLKTLLKYAGGPANLREMNRRPVLNVLLGNGDAHIKNWPLIYDNPTRPRLAPVHDLVSTVAYTQHDSSLALIDKVRAHQDGLALVRELR